MDNQGDRSVGDNRVVRLILDTDMLTDCDDTAALGMLHAMADAGEAQMLARVVSSRYPQSAVVVDTLSQDPTCAYN